MSFSNNFILAFSFCALQLFGQPGFNKYYPAGSLSSARKVITVGENILFTAYYKDSLTGQQSFELNLLDPDGTVLKKKRLVFGNYDCLAYEDDGFQHRIGKDELILSAGSYDGINPLVICASVKISTLDTNWVTYIREADYRYRLNNVLKVAPNQIWLYGARGNDTENTRPYIVKLDTLGNFLSSKEFSDLVDFDVLQAQYRPLENNFIFTCVNYKIPQAIQSEVFCVDTNGKTLWRTQIGSHPNNSIFHEMQIVGKEVIISASYADGKYTEDSHWNAHKLQLIKLSAENGQIIWNNVYGERSLYNMLRGMVIESNGSITAAGSHYHQTVKVGEKSDGVIIQVDKDGKLLKMRGYVNFTKGRESLHDIVKTEDGGYVACGSHENVIDSYSWVLKVNSELDGANVYPLSTLDDQRLFSTIVYPNPAREIIHIPVPDQNFYRIEVYDCTGRSVIKSETQPEAGIITINIENLPRGLYTIVLPGNVFNNTMRFIKI